MRRYLQLSWVPACLLAASGGLASGQVIEYRYDPGFSVPSAPRVSSTHPLADSVVLEPQDEVQAISARPRFIGPELAPPTNRVKVSPAILTEETRATTSAALGSSSVAATPVTWRRWGYAYGGYAGGYGGYYRGYYRGYAPYGYGYGGYSYPYYGYTGYGRYPYSGYGYGYSSYRPYYSFSYGYSSPGWGGYNGGYYNRGYGYGTYPYNAYPYGGYPAISYGYGGNSAYCGW